MPKMSTEAQTRSTFHALPDLIRTHAAEHPLHAALIQDKTVFDYRTLDSLMDQVAAALQRDGLKAGDAVALCAVSSPLYAAIFLGALRAGVVVAPLAPSVTAAQFKSMLKDSGALLLFLDETASHLASGVAAEMRCIQLRHGADGIGLEDWLADPAASPAPLDFQPDWPFNIIYSSGTTGAPKGIVQSHGMRWAHVQRGDEYGYTGKTVTLLATPLYSNTSLVVLLPTIANGGTVHIMARFDALDYLELAQEFRVTHTMLVPVQYQRIMALPQFSRFDLSSFRVKFCTSAPFHAGLKADVLERWPGELVEIYGMTEGGGTCVLHASRNPGKLHTVGQPVPGHDIRLVDEDGKVVARGEAGEVVGHSSGMMLGYHRQPELTREVEWFDSAGKRFIRSGDIGRFDDDGFLILTDRKKDMIISGGFNIYPSDLESEMRKHEDVEDVAVVGVPSSKWGETPVAFVVLSDDSELPCGELLKWFNRRVGATQRLASLHRLDSLPRSAIGKVLKRKLRELYTKTLAGDAAT